MIKEKSINKFMTFGDLLESYPEAAWVLARYGLHCIGCHIGFMETIEQGARAHGLNDEDIDKMIEELNKKAVKDKEV